MSFQFTFLLGKNVKYFLANYFFKTVYIPFQLGNY